MTWLDEIRPDLEQMIRNISQKNLFYGNKIPKSVMDQFEIEQKTGSIGVLVPYWLPVVERGRGKRKSNRDHGLAFKIFEWMRRRSMFKSTTAEGQMREARFITWYINKYGNKQFRNKVFIDVYTTERAKTIEAIDKKFSLLVSKITTEVI